MTEFTRATEHVIQTVVYTFIVVAFMWGTWATQVWFKTTMETVVKQRVAAAQLLEYYKRRARSAARYEAVLAHCGNGGAFYIGDDVVVLCTQVAMPEGTGLRPYNSVR